MIELPEGQQSNLGPFFNESADDLNVSIRKLVAGLDTLGIRPYADNAPSWSWVMFCLDRIETLRREVARVRADAASAPASVDASFVARKREFSARTFGPQALAGVIDHIRKELVEVEADPTDLGEWVDVIMLGLDGAWRAGHEPQEILDAIVAKQARCEARTWPDWRTTDPGQAIEHDRGVAPAESVVGAPTAISALRAGARKMCPSRWCRPTASRPPKRCWPNANGSCWSSRARVPPRLAGCTTRTPDHAHLGSRARPLP
ncbi:dATP/dGTP pyrophosphohydrolase domain-containing protein [Phytohabitans houttuyneae]|nr:dATP/dGTP pyrophosphohydrolase domain-containing protein [Phytohabitans houttuyneae]